MVHIWSSAQAITLDLRLELPEDTGHISDQGRSQSILRACWTGREEKLG